MGKDKDSWMCLQCGYEAEEGDDSLRKGAERILSPRHVTHQLYSNINNGWFLELCELT